MSKPFSEDALYHADSIEDGIDGYYVSQCPECGHNITISADNDAQQGRCFGCGYHEKDSDFSCDPYSPLNFED